MMNQTFVQKLFMGLVKPTYVTLKKLDRSKKARLFKCKLL